MSEVKLFRLSGSAMVIDMHTGHNATLRPGLVVLSEDAHTHAMAALAAECERLRELFKESEQHLHHWQRQAAANGRSTKVMETERDAALAELAALKGGREPIGEFRESEYDGEPAFYWVDRVPPLGTKLYAAPPAQASAWVPEGWKLVPVEPTGAMMLNESGCQHHAWDDNGCAARRVRFGVWAKMLAAAPTPGASD